jgi:hypothetical protein
MEIFEKQKLNSRNSLIMKFLIISVFAFSIFFLQTNFVFALNTTWDESTNTTWDNSSNTTWDSGQTNSVNTTWDSGSTTSSQNTTWDTTQSSTNTTWDTNYQTYYPTYYYTYSRSCSDQCSYSGQTEYSGNSSRTCGFYNSDSCFEWGNWSSYSYWTVSLANSCTDECSYSGQTEYSSNQKRTCGGFDSDSCLDWSNWTYMAPSCSDECSYSGQTEFSGNSSRTCGGYDNDSCLEWGSWSSSYSSTTYSSSSCSDDCPFSGKTEFSGNQKRTCGGFDSDTCIEWSSWETLSNYYSYSSSTTTGTGNFSVSLTPSLPLGCSPLENVSLTATISGGDEGYYAYYFDCMDNGSWEKTLSSNYKNLTVNNLCNYWVPGIYTARVRVLRLGSVAENTTTINVKTCGEATTPIKGVLGAATSVSTGITDNIFLDSFFIPLAISLLLVWIFKSGIINTEEWIDGKKQQTEKYRFKKLLQLKISQAKIKEFIERAIP